MLSSPVEVFGVVAAVVSEGALDVWAILAPNDIDQIVQDFIKRHGLLGHPVWRNTQGSHTQVRQAFIFAKNQPNAHAAIELKKQAIDSPKGRHLQSPRIGTVEPVFGDIRHNKRLNRFTLRGKERVNAQWSLYCLVHTIERLTNRGYAL